MLEKNNFVFPQIKFLRKDKVKNKEVNIYKLDWSNFDKHTQKNHLDWAKNYWPNENIKFIKYLPEEIDNHYCNLQFAIPDNYLEQIRNHARLANDGWKTYKGFDTVIRQLMVQPAISHVFVCFQLVCDCLYDDVNKSYLRDDIIKPLSNKILTYKFWGTYTGRGTLFKRSTLDVELKNNIYTNLSEEWQNNEFAKHKIVQKIQQHAKLWEQVCMYKNSGLIFNEEKIEEKLNIEEFIKQKLNIKLSTVFMAILKMFYKNKNKNKNIYLTNEESQSIKNLGIDINENKNLINKFGMIHDELILPCGRRCGKDILCSVIALYQAYNYEQNKELIKNNNLIVLSVSHEQSNNIRKCIYDIINNSNLKEYTLTNNSLVYNNVNIKFLFSSNQIRGISAFSAILNEFDFNKDKNNIYSCMYPLIKCNKGNLFIISSPFNEQKNKSIFIDLFDNSKTNRLCARVPAWINNDKGKLEEENSFMSVKQFNQEFGAKF